MIIPMKTRFRMKVAIGIMLYVAGWYGTTGACIANGFQSPENKTKRDVSAQCLAISAFPFTWVIVALGSGFYADGWERPRFKQ